MTVAFYVPEIAVVGMSFLPDRKHILRCYEAFKHLLDDMEDPQVAAALNGMNLSES
jgi:hypothetical protein